jgi:hypothetical protein
MKYLKTYKLFESNLNEWIDIIKLKLIDLSDIDIKVSFNPLSDNFIEISISKDWNAPAREISWAPTPPGGLYPGNLFLWKEIKESILDLIEWYFSEFGPFDSEIYNSKPIRFATNSTRFIEVWNSKEELFDIIEGISDFTSFTNLRIEMKIPETI